MRLLILCLVLNTSLIAAQSETELTRSWSYESIKEIVFERYTQQRSAFTNLLETPDILLSSGLITQRIGSNTFVNIPLEITIRINKKLKIFAGPQANFLQDGNTGEMRLLGTSVRVGLEYQFTPNWNAAVQFTQLLYETKSLKTMNIEQVQPIQVRTGLKF